MNKQLGVGIAIGMVAIYLIAIAIPTIDARDNPLIIQSGSGGGGETTQCINMAMQYQIIVNSTGGNCFVRALANGTGITLATNTTHVIINSTGSGEVNTASCIGSVSPFSECIFFDKNGQDLRFKRLLEGSGIALATNGTHILITNTAPDNTTCANVGTGVDVYKDGECNFRTLISDNSAIVLTENTNDITITPEWQLLCENVLASTATSLSCNNFAEKNTLIVYISARIVTNSLVSGIQFNGDTSSIYTWRVSINGGADVTGISDDNCKPVATNSLAIGAFNVMQLVIKNNPDTESKLVTSTYVGSGNNDPASTTGKIEFSCKWTNTTDKITSISIMRDAGSGNYNVDTSITVWGYD